MAAMLAELVVVWGWHLPLLHHAARSSTAALAAEQASFLAVGLALWLSVLGGRAAQRHARLAGGVVALLLTSMHMTLLGVRKSVVYGTSVSVRIDLGGRRNIKKQNICTAPTFQLTATSQQTH